MIYFVACIACIALFNSLIANGKVRQLKKQMEQLEHKSVLYQQHDTHLDVYDLIVAGREGAAVEQAQKLYYMTLQEATLYVQRLKSSHSNK